MRTHTNRAEGAVISPIAEYILTANPHGNAPGHGIRKGTDQGLLRGLADRVPEKTCRALFGRDRYLFEPITI